MADLQADLHKQVRIETMRHAEYTPDGVRWIPVSGVDPWTLSSALRHAEAEIRRAYPTHEEELTLRRERDDARAEAQRLRDGGWTGLVEAHKAVAELVAERDAARAEVAEFVDALDDLLSHEVIVGDRVRDRAEALVARHRGVPEVEGRE